MMRQALQQAPPGRGRADMRPAIGGIVLLHPGRAGAVPRTRTLYARSTGAIAWRRRAPGAPFRQRLAQWRVRNWRRAVLAWFVLSLVIVGVAAEPAADFPRAQLRRRPPRGSSSG